MQSSRKCAVETCPNASYCKSYCSPHYDRWRRNGNPLPQPRKKRTVGPLKPVMDRLMAKVEKTDSCWLWRGAVNNFGYAQIHVSGKSLYAHRVIYEEIIAPIPSGMFLDHACHVHNCVNPKHLKPVTNKQNLENRAGATRVSTSGIRGVWMDKRRGTWSYSVGHFGVRYRADGFRTAEEANRAVIAKRNELFTNNLRDRAE